MKHPDVIANELEECRQTIRETIRAFDRLLRKNAEEMTHKRAHMYCVGQILQATGDNDYMSEMFSMREIIQEYRESRDYGEGGE